MKARQTLSKTVTGATAADLDTNYAAFVQGLKEEDLISVHFFFVSRDTTTLLFAALIIYAS